MANNIPWRKPEEITREYEHKPLLVVCGDFGRIPFLVIGRVVFLKDQEPIWKYDETFYDFSRPFFIADEIIAWCEITPPEWTLANIQTPTQEPAINEQK